MTSNIQPETMEQLLLSLQREQRFSAQKVIPTIATYNFSALGSATRTIFQNAFNAEMARHLGLASLPPDSGPINAISAQTDFWYTQNDPGNQFDRLINILVAEGRRRR